MPNILKPMAAAFGQLIVSIFASLFFIPLSFLFPKRNNRISVIGRHNGLFLDNTKYFYLYLCDSTNPKPDIEYVALSHYSFDELSNAGLPVSQYPGFRSIRYLLTSSIVIVDSAEWIHHGRFQLAFRSKVVQLWHGIPLKQIEIPLYLKELEKLPFVLKYLYKGFKSLTGRYSKNEIVLSTSRYLTDVAFRPAFNARNFLSAGYPRNDILFERSDHIDPGDSQYINADIEIINQLAHSKKSFNKTVLYAPTFRKDLENPFSPDVLDLDRLNKFAVSHDILFVFKLHPVLSKISTLESYSNILNYRTTSDIYPALRYFDALITDYSSIYFDFLLLDRPIIFYPFDLTSYVLDDRPLVFEYRSMTPGEICMDQDSLEKSVLSLETDACKDDRKRVRDLAFEHKDGNSSQRLWDYINKKYLN
jgi:CDP-glycerol glycerophosphotransferase